MTQSATNHPGVVLAFVLMFSSPSLASNEDGSSIFRWLKSTDNMIASCQVTTVQDPDPVLVTRTREELGKAVTLPQGKRTEMTDEVIRLLNNKISYKTTYRQDGQPAETRRWELFVKTPQRVERVVCQGPGDDIVGVISEDEIPPVTLYFDQAMGRRLRAGPKWVASETLLLGCKPIRMDDSRWKCEFTTGGITHTYTYNDRLGGAIESYVVHYGPDSFDEITCEDYREVDGVFVPHKMTLRVTYKDSAGKLRTPILSTLTASSYRINARDNTDDSFMYSYSRGMNVLDKRANAHLTITEDNTRLDDKMVHKLLKQAATPKRN